METINHNKLNTYPRYLKYKDSGIDWIGEIPEHWSTGKGFTIFKEKKVPNNGLKVSQVLSLSYGKIIVKPEDKLFGLVPESFETYQIVEPDDIIIRCTDLQNDKTSLRTGISFNHGIITSAYLNLCVNNPYHPKYFHALLHAFDVCKAIYKYGSGLRQNLSFVDFKHLLLPIPPLAEQQQIADFLDSKTALIDEAIGLKQQQIDKLKEYKQITIQTAVTRGLNPNAPMKDSGIDWIGEIPEHWEVSKLGQCLFPISIKNHPKLPLLSITREQGVIKRDIENLESNHNFIPDDLSSYKLIKKGQFGMNKMKAWQGSYGVSDYTGIVSPAYYIFNFIKEINGLFFHWAIRSKTYISFFGSASDGVRIGQWDLSKTRMKEIPFIIPPLSEQQQIADYLEQKSAEIDATIAHYEQQIDKLKEYKTVLIQAAVTGQIEVSNDG